MSSDSNLTDTLYTSNTWNDFLFEEIVEEKGLIRGPFGGALKKEIFVTEGFKVYEQRNAIYKSVEIGNYYIDDVKFKELKRFEVKKNDFILSCSGTIGKLFRIPSNHPKGIINQALLIIRVDESKVDLDFFEQIFNDQKIQSKIIDDTQGGAMKNLVGMSEFKKTTFSLPLLPEQKKIAEALSDCDNWIESIEKLIEKKKLIKQGAMQKLLEPKEDWEELSVFEIAELNKNLFNDGDWIESEFITDNGVRLIQTGNIGVGSFVEKTNKKYISEESFKKLNCKEVFEDDILICRLAEPAGRCCIMPKLKEKVVVSVDITIFRPNKEKFERLFLKYLMCKKEWFDTVLESVGGTTHKRISRSNLGNIKLFVPHKKEQFRISSVLKDIDSELFVLESKLQKAKEIKKGMMQDLLTGKVRLV